ncbi:MOSC domain-containing protein [Porticoccaceae bacterium]|jgi:MOSC domain-containing protein YiiM|nr:MOSC domain-containing protein [Porticoccaceae bacterium]MDB4032655.1 MOSC domain-containing protein [Porticoccaceae bacterium]|tara:strand:- start:1066 stop:1533 length:468 start_codon:yes stop_codon:yes gene_type:complete
MTEGRVKGIYIAPKMGANVSGHQKVSVRAGKGIEGDRYFSNTGKNRSNYKGQPDWEITLIESEVIVAFNQDTGNKFHESDFRRNIVTEGVRLNDLVGKTFNINGVSFFGVQLCEPCASLQKRLAVKILPDLIGKGGLRAQIRGVGLLNVGDAISS